MTYEDQLRDQLFREPSDELKALAHQVVGCAIAVHRELGPGYSEQTYQLALETELEYAGIPFQAQAPVELLYRGRRVGQYRFDLVIDDRLLIEIKATESLANVHIAQVIAYLKASRLPLGLILNFNARVLADGLRRVYPPT